MATDPTRDRGPSTDPSPAPPAVAPAEAPVAPASPADPRGDPTRLSALHASGLLDAAAEEAFDRLTRLAVRLVGVPAAFISLVDRERDFYLSACGFGEPLASARELRGPTFCHYAVARTEPLVIPDTAADPVYRQVPTVQTLGVAAYVGVPIRTADGHALGSFCAIDVRPHAWTADEVEVLRELAASAEREIALRAAAARAERLRDEADAERARLAAVLDVLPLGVLIADADGRLTTATAPARRIWQAASGRAEMPPSLAYVDALQGWRRDTGERVRHEDWPMVRALTRGEATTLEVEFRRDSAAPTVLLATASPIRDGAGAVAGAVVTLLDLTERAALEERLQQAERMEALGQLAGGVAHDFNNLLTVITANLEFAQTELPADHPVRADLGEIGLAAQRARALVRQLLAFSRKQAVQPRVVDLRDVVRGAQRLLDRVIGEEVLLDVQLGAAPAAVRADPGQLEQVLVNLAVNARDALLTPLHGHPGTGGVLEIGVDRVTLEPSTARVWAGVEPGEFVRLRVRDTGHGMDAAIRARAFDPFFTTKEVGRGTGLGLATVFGVVRQAGGAVRIDSAPGRGTAVTVLLPAAGGTPVDAAGAEERVPAARPGTTVLLVEDELAVRMVARRVLERHGYAVLEARHGADALLVWEEHGPRVDVVVTDVRMPELGGLELVARLRRLAPELPVVYVSGYVEDGAVRVRRDDEACVEKPFTADELLGAVRRVLGARARAG